MPKKSDINESAKLAKFTPYMKYNRNEYDNTNKIKATLVWYFLNTKNFNCLRFSIRYTKNIIGDIAAQPAEGAKNKLSKGIRNKASLNIKSTFTTKHLSKHLIYIVYIVFFSKKTQYFFPVVCY